MREIIYKVVDKLNDDVLLTTNLPADLDEFVQLFEVHSAGGEFVIFFYGSPIWSSVCEILDETMPEERLYNHCNEQVAKIRSTILHITAQVGYVPWAQ